MEEQVYTIFNSPYVDPISKNINWELRFYLGKCNDIPFNEPREINGQIVKAYWYGIAKVSFPVKYPFQLLDGTWIGGKPETAPEIQHPLSLLYIPKKKVKPKYSKPKKHNKLLSFPRMSRTPTPENQQLYVKRGECCFYCKQYVRYEEITFDHVKPKSKGYSLKNNMAFACTPCNTLKGNLFINEFMHKIKKLLKDAEPIDHKRYLQILESCEDLLHQSENNKTE